ncbi:MAG: metallophosphoesterase [Oligoflexales bacterium]
MRRRVVTLGAMVVASFAGVFAAGNVYAKANKYCITGDMGTGKQQKLAAALEAEQCDYILFAGDLVYSSGIDSPTDSEYKKFAAPFGNLLDPSNPVKILLAVGNHDHRGNPEAWLDVAERSNGKIIFPNLWYGQNFDDGVCIFGFDTNAKMDEQAAWFREQKAQYKNCQFSIAFAHHPYLSAGEHGDASGDLKSFLEDTVVGHVDLYAAGHDHDLEDAGDVKGTRFLVSGAGGKLRGISKGKIRVWGVSQLGYFTLQMDGKKANYQFKSVNAKDAPMHQGEIPAQGLR